MDVLSGELHDLQCEHADVIRRLSKLREQNDKRFQQLIDSTDPTLLSKNREQLEELLDAPNGNMRCAALCILEMRNWTSKLATKCPSLAVADPDASVRGVAVLVLPTLQAELGKPRIETLLAQIVLNPGEQNMIRRAAFKALLGMKGVPFLSKSWKDSARSDFPNSVELDYVRSCIPSPESDKGTVP